MSRGSQWMVAMLVLVTAGWAVSQGEAQAGSLAVERSAIAESVEDREPVGEAASFSADVGEVACFTRIVGAEGEERILHVWRHNGEERAKVALSVRGSAWRTWSTKKILPTWTGSWTVEVQDADGNVLKTLSFVIGEGSSSTGVAR